MSEVPLYCGSDCCKCAKRDACQVLIDHAAQGYLAHKKQLLAPSEIAPAVGPEAGAVNFGPLISRLGSNNEEMKVE